MKIALTIKCEFCGKKKDKLGFWIGASTEPDWTMVEGTGKITCPECYPRAIAEAKIIKRQALKNFTGKAAA